MYVCMYVKVKQTGVRLTYTDVSRYLITAQVNQGAVTVQYVSGQVVIDFDILIAGYTSITNLLYTHHNTNVNVNQKIFNVWLK